MLLRGENIIFSLVRRRGSRGIRLCVESDGTLTVRAPVRASDVLIGRMLKQSQSWLLKHRQALQERGLDFHPRIDDAHLFKQYRAAALRLVEKRLIELNEPYGFVFDRVSVRRQRRSWGTCSSKRTLCFNYKIVFLPDHLADYIIVHELCHLKEMNHSSRFWDLVAQTVPDHRQRRVELRRWKQPGLATS